MSKRETKLFSIRWINNKDEFENYLEIKKIADNFKAKLTYLKAVNKDFHVNAFIGMSDLDIRYGNKAYKGCKKRGRKEIITKPKRFKGAKEKYLKPWHLHLLIEANPGETVAKIIVDYFNKVFKRKVASSFRVDEGFFDYVMKQSRKARFVVEQNSASPLVYNFRKIYKGLGVV